jgi:ABC-type Na+ efflux pump permease subunit
MNKLWHSYKKELKLASRGFYFYIEIGMAVIFLVILLMVVPENFDNSQTEFVMFDVPEPYNEFLMTALMEEDLDGELEDFEIKHDGEVYTFDMTKSKDKEIVLFDDLELLKTLTESEKPLVGARIYMNDDNQLSYDYFLQGYENSRLKNLYLAIHMLSLEELEQLNAEQEVRSLGAEQDELTDREFMVPVFLSFNGSLMGLFIIASYIFLDKGEGIIKAYAVTASKVSTYLLSKVGILMTTSLMTSLLITIPVMGLKPNYLLFVVILLTSSFFASSLGLLLSSFYKDLMQSFGALYILMIVMMLPNIAYFLPSWDPSWLKAIPSYYIINSFKEIMIKGTDVNFVLLSSAGFVVIGLVLFFIANKRFEGNLTA